MVELTPLEYQEMSISLQVYPIEPQTELPQNLTMILLSETGEPLGGEIRAGNHNNYLEQPLTGKSGERFSVKLVLGEISLVENFII